MKHDERLDLRLNRDLKRRFKAVADRRNLKMSELIIALMRACVEEEEACEAARNLEPEQI